MKIIDTTILVLLLILINLKLIGQSGEEIRILPAINGPAGNYIYVVGYGDLLDNPSILDDTKEFVIERITKKTPDEATKESDAKKIGTLKRISKYKDLKKYYSEEKLEEIKSQFGNLTEDELTSLYLNFKSVEDLPFLYNLIETKQALGMVFLDTEITKGYYYIYNIIRVSTNGEKEYWGNAYTKGGLGNYTLKHLKASWSQASARDSNYHLQWQLPVSEDLLNSIVKDSAHPDESYNEVLQYLPFKYSDLTADVYTNTGNGYQYSGNYYPRLSDNNDTLYFEVIEGDVSAETVTAYIKLKDEVYNTGISSDTALVFTEDSASVQMIYNILVKDTLNGINISWEQLPEKPYYTGIQIIRYDSDEMRDTIAMLDPIATEYTDRNIAIGQYYRYSVSAIFVPQSGLVQPVGAQGTGTFSRFTKPLPPYNLMAETMGKYIGLEWSSTDEPSVYGYYVYRGTSSENLELIKGPIFEKKFIDSLEALSGRSFYYYAVAAQNYRQDTSVYSNIVSIKPNKSIELMNPTPVNLYFANGKIIADWDDIRNGDNIIEGYKLQRRESQNSEFENIHDDLLGKPSFSDDLIIPGKTYSYRVAAVSIYGDMSSYSEATQITVPQNIIGTIDVFSARNLTHGIKISIPQMSVDNQSGFNIYRREEGQEAFVKIAKLDGRTFNYLDTDVINDKYYVYVITINSNDNREGSRGKSITVKRK